MGVEFRCDGCNKLGTHRCGYLSILNMPTQKIYWDYPDGWLTASKDEDVFIACSRECADVVSSMMGLQSCFCEKCKTRIEKERTEDGKQRD